MDKLLISTIGMFWMLLFPIAIGIFAYIMDVKTIWAQGVKIGATSLGLICLIAVVHTTCTAFAFNDILTKIAGAIALIFGLSIVAFIYKKSKIFGYIGFGGIIALTIFFVSNGIILTSH